MLTIHLRINDAATSQPVPVRLRITDAAGRTYAPLGRTADFPTGRNEAVGGHLKLGGERWCYIDGSCEVPLPAGEPLRIQAVRGPHYLPLDESVVLGAGQMALRFSITRSLDGRADGYHPGDVRAHYISPHAALLEARAEDLDVANVLATPFAMLAIDGNSYSVVPDLLTFSGQAPALGALEGPCVAVNTLNVHPVLGSVGLLHSHRPVFPLTFGGPDETDDWSVCDWCDQCHRKGGLTTWVDAFEPFGSLIGGEALAATLLGKVDAIELSPSGRASPSRALLPWVYRLWDLGLRIALAGGSGKDNNRVPLGAMRTYARVEGGFSLNGWLDGIRSGDTFASNGPLLGLEVNGLRPGPAITVPADCEIAARAESLKAFERLDGVANGQVIETVQAENRDGRWSASLRIRFTAGEPGWIAARCIGGDGFAHTSPVMLAGIGRWTTRRSQSAVMLGNLIEQTREWIEQHGRFASPRRKHALLDRCREARAKLEERS
jgi:hypothetical protein